MQCVDAWGTFQHIASPQLDTPAILYVQLDGALCISLLVTALDRWIHHRTFESTNRNHVRCPPSSCIYCKSRLQRHDIASYVRIIWLNIKSQCLNLEIAFVIEQSAFITRCQLKNSHCGEGCLTRCLSNWWTRLVRMMVLASASWRRNIACRNWKYDTGCKGESTYAYTRSVMKQAISGAVLKEYLRHCGRSVSLQ